MHIIDNKIALNRVLSESPIQQIEYAGFTFHIKRDDLLNPYFSGNKARKFAYYLDHTPDNITDIVGYGSIQANSLYSLAALAKIKGWQLHYYVDRIPNWLNNTSTGNYAQALLLGAKVIERTDLSLNHSHTNNMKVVDQNLDTFMNQMAKQLPENTLFIPEGGRSAHAQAGIAILAKEIVDYCQSNNWFEQHEVVNIMLPSGTGTTALFLQTWFCEQAFPINVLTCACVGDTDYLTLQFNSLNSNKKQWPTILPTAKKYHFGKLYPEHYKRWKTLQNETNIEFELLYDPIGWESILIYLNDHTITSPIIYIHQGGIVGNQTMVPRYKRKYPHLM